MGVKTKHFTMKLLYFIFSAILFTTSEVMPEILGSYFWSGQMNFFFNSEMPYFEKDDFTLMPVVTESDPFPPFIKWIVTSNISDTSTSRVLANEVALGVDVCPWDYQEWMVKDQFGQWLQDAELY